MVDDASVGAVVENSIYKAVSYTPIDDGTSVGVVVGNSIDKAVSYTVIDDGASVGSVDGVLVGSGGGNSNETVCAPSIKGGSIADGNNSK